MKYRSDLPEDATSEEIQKHLRENMPERIYEAHGHSIDHRTEVEGSSICGCFYCLHIFPPSSITEWIKNDRNEFAMCPKCGIDAVLGDASGYPITKEFLEEMNKYWFDGDAL